MRLILAVIEDDLALEVAKELAKKEIRSTKLSSSGGFLKRGNTTLLIGIKAEETDETIKFIREACENAENISENTENEYQANIFVLPVEDFINI